jgi:protein tyrosine/serine phosphatase
MRRLERQFVVAFASALLTLGGCATPAHPKWAMPLDLPGLPNCHRVCKDLYRGAQFDEDGVAQLKKLGVKTVVTLRQTQSDDELLAGSGIPCVQIPTKAWDSHQEDQAAEFLRVVSDRGRRPVFVHCSFGGDRTGAMVAVYRMAVQGWTREEALAEMRDDLYEFHEIWDDLIEFVNNVDIEKVKRKAGLVKT